MENGILRIFLPRIILLDSGEISMDKIFDIVAVRRDIIALNLAGQNSRANGFSVRCVAYSSDNIE